ncbi:MAG: domain S-box protein [Gammaproteobacteria bacterium]|jgi:CheY-like chemotaxis protein|nr:domain S-box protein [Gammaproteobacteria bacterium]
MKSAEFLALIAANANKTKNLRSYFGPWPSSINRVPDEIAGKVGRIVAFVQAKINEGHFCNKETEYLLIYNFQPLHLSKKDVIYYSLDLLRKPTSRIKRVKEKIGEPMQLVIQGETGDVMNNSQFMVSVELATIEEIARDKLEPPTIYGNYTAYAAPCCFVTLLSDELLSAELLFDGGYDKSSMVQEGKAFENLMDARRMLAESQAVGRYIAEITDTEDEIPRLKKQGLCLETVKLMDYGANTVIVNTHPRVLFMETPIEDELSRLEEAFGMLEIPSIKATRIAVANALDPTGEDKRDLQSEINRVMDPFKEEMTPPPSSLVVPANTPAALNLLSPVVLTSASLAEAFAKIEPPFSDADTAGASGSEFAEDSPSPAGARSCVFFPLVRAASASPATGSSSIRKRRILIVEDNVINQKMLLRILKSAGHRCRIANDGLEALVAYDQFTFDIIFMDIVMPNMDGLTATQEIRKREKEKNLRRTPIIAITANALEKDQQKGREAGIEKYIAKPFSKEEIYAQLVALEEHERVVKNSACPFS